MKRNGEQSFERLFQEAAESDEFWTATAIMSFTEELAVCMERNGISRAELASRIGVSAPYVTKILKGNVNFTIETMVRLARAVGADLDLHLKSRSDAAAQRAAR